MVAICEYAPYEFKRKLLNLESLSDRRVNACRLFMYDILTGKTDSSYFMSLVNINVPCNSLRNYSLILPEYHRTTYGSHEPVTNMVL